MFIKKLVLKYWETQALNSIVREDFEKAKWFFEKIYKKISVFPGIEYNLGVVNLALKNFEEAEKFFATAVDKDPRYQTVRSLADLYYLWGKRGNAKKFYRIALRECEIAKEVKIIQRRLISCDNEEAFYKTRQSHKYFDDGIQQMAEGKSDLAVNSFKKAIQYDDTNFIAYNNLGTVCMNDKKDFYNARKYFRKADGILDNPVVKQNLKGIERMLQKGKLDAAATTFN